MSRVNPRARSRPDRGGDPLDGLVNLFDLGIVLAVAFMLAALSSLDLTDVLTGEGEEQSPAQERVIADESDRVEEAELEPGQRVVGRGERVGEIYRLEDGRTVIVRPGRNGDRGAGREVAGPGP